MALEKVVGEDDTEKGSKGDERGTHCGFKIEIWSVFEIDVEMWELRGRMEKGTKPRRGRVLYLHKLAWCTSLGVPAVKRITDVLLPVRGI